MRSFCLAAYRARLARPSPCARRVPGCTARVHCAAPTEPDDHDAPEMLRRSPKQAARSAPDRGRPHRGPRSAHTGVLLMAAVTAAGLVVAASPASAATVHVVALAASLDQVLTNLRNWIMGILALVATVFLTLGGARYIIAAGDAGEVSKAKECFKGAALGYALAVLAPLVVQILRGIVGA